MENEEVRGSMVLLAQGEAEELPCGPSCGYPGKEGADGTLDQVLASRGGGGGQGCPWAVRSHTWRIVHWGVGGWGGDDSLVTHPGAQKGEQGCSQSSPFGTLERPVLSRTFGPLTFVQVMPSPPHRRLLLMAVSLQASPDRWSFCTSQIRGL